MGVGLVVFGLLLILSWVNSGYLWLRLVVIPLIDAESYSGIPWRVLASALILAVLVIGVVLATKGFQEIFPRKEGQ